MFGRHSLNDGTMRVSAVLVGERRASVCGYADVGHDCAFTLRGSGARVLVAE